MNYYYILLFETNEININRYTTTARFLGSHEQLTENGEKMEENGEKMERKLL